MNGSLDRVRQVMRGEIPDRAPLYDLLRNDAVIRHFAGETVTCENAATVVFRAYAPAVDATRPLVRLPRPEATETLPDGRPQQVYRWTIWTGHTVYADTAAYVSAKRAELDKASDGWTSEQADGMRQWLASIADHRTRLGEVFFFASAPSVGLMGIYEEVGLEQFAYYLADCPDIIDGLLELRTRQAVAWINHIPPDHGIEAVFIGDDLAFKTGPLLSPDWFEQHYYKRLGSICDAYHRQGISVLFHSDGNLNSLLDGLVEAGIDGLNPIEILAGMDVGDIHRRYPHLFLAGGIDVSDLLPHGTVQQVKDTVHRTLDAAGGRLLVGSTTELHDAVPLANFLALREAVLEHR